MEDTELKGSVRQLKKFLLCALVPWIALGVMFSVLDDQDHIGPWIIALLALPLLPFVSLIFVLPVARALGKSTFAWSLISIMIPAGYLLGGLALILDANEKLSEQPSTASETSTTLHENSDA